MWKLYPKIYQGSVWVDQTKTGPLFRIRFCRKRDFINDFTNNNTA